MNKKESVSEDKMNTSTCTASCKYDLKEGNKMELSPDEVNCSSSNDKCESGTIELQKNNTYKTTSKIPRHNTPHVERDTEQGSGQDNLSTCPPSMVNTDNLITVLLIKPNDKSFDFFCIFCQKDFSSKSALQDHMLIHSGEKPFSCNLCEKRFNKKGNLNRHLNTHGGEKEHQCGICGKGFFHASSLKDHMKVHTGEKNYECQICKKRFTSHCNLNKHKLLHTGVKPYSCDYCGKQFSESGNLAKHKLIHTGELRHTCDVCGKSFRYGNVLQRHKRIHTGEAPYKCPVCLKSFFSNGELHNHSVIHSGIKQFKCDDCGKSFARKHHLQQHTLSHLGVKPYSCEMCGSKFVQTSGLRKHIRSFHPSLTTDWQDLPESNETSMHIVSQTCKKDTPYSCDVCGIKFVFASVLQKHKKKFHSSQDHVDPPSSSDALDEETEKRNNVEMIQTYGDEIKDSELIVDEIKQEVEDIM